MKPEIDPAMIAAFGSETRVRTLAVLAGATRPLTPYRVGKTGGVALPKVYMELQRLEKAGIVRRSPTGVELADADLRGLLARRVRLSWSGDWGATYEERSRRARSLRPQIARITAAVDPSNYAPNPAIARKYAREFERPAIKDQWPPDVIGDRISRKRR